MSITFEQLLTDPKYREMSQMQIRDLIMSDGFPTADMFKIDKIVNPDGKYNSVSKPLYLHLQKLKAESEKKAEDIKVIDRYPMCKDQPAQIDCRRADCIYQNKGQCSNISPAITLNDKSTFVCWSYKDAKGENKAEPFATGKITEAPEGFAEKIRSAGNEIKIKKPIYGESPIISHINDIQMAALIEKISKQFMKGINKATEDIHKPYNPKLTGIVSMSDVTTVAVKPEPSIQITDQKAREICAKYFNCPPNELKILHP